MVRRVLHAVALATVVVLAMAGMAHADGYTSDDTLAAIDEASATSGVSHAWLYSIVRCETGGTFNPYAIGKLGEKGAAQLASFGELPRFYAYGYNDPFSPYQAVGFLAIRLNEGGRRAWSCA